MDSESFSTPRLLLRELTLDDAPSLLPIWSDIRVTRYMKIDRLTTEEEARQLISLLKSQVKAGQSSRYAIILKDTNTVIGTCGFDRFHSEHESGTISYELSKTCWGKGYASEALFEIIKDGFTRLGLHRIEARIEPENDRSYHALHKLGFMHEGRLRGALKKGDKFVDQLVFSILSEELDSSLR
ncbi:GNAT family N-acetyltransferase [Shouchella sp. JSM 1781072]|uniref:GNAT family N-acetyltransferase n=1 Tax=Bacillaceae TaxID=186817 RepID=UPI00159B8956|nr:MULTISPECIES: GNAT family protein [Bacillaceae]UTR04930.1 GNAT family N-acetyltransferase [Alkalihalobacillus sp. LMS6]